MPEKSDSSVRLFSYSDDQPNEEMGLLIPPKSKQNNRSTKDSFTPNTVRSTAGRSVGRAALSVLGLFAVMLLGTSGYGLLSQVSQPASPIITITSPYTKNSTALEYGPQVALSSSNFFLETRDAFIDESLTFLEVDLSQEQIRFFKNGVLLQSAEIISVGEEGSWLDTPSGLYRVEEMKKTVFHSTSQSNLPWLITFQSNYLIHGSPVYPNGEDVPEDFAGGGIRLNEDDAEELFQYLEIDTPILVHSLDNETKEKFVYEPRVPEIGAKHYFIGDLDNGSVLASSDLSSKASIASLTKLMTAVIAAEEIYLDSRIQVTSPTFVQSLIPRLSERSTVSMYSLLQLLLVESSNEASETIAGEIGRDNFIAAMNAKARQLGLMNTQFADPSGLSSENVSSIGDLYQLTKYIYDEKKFIFDITAKNNLNNVYVGGEFDGLVNFNEVEDMDSFIGGKVGETLAAGQTSISLHQIEFQGETRIIVVILLDSENRTEDIKTVISYAKTRFDS
jgi:hypothetical protein